MWSTKQCGYCCPHRTFELKFSFNFKTESYLLFFTISTLKGIEDNSIGAGNYYENRNKKKILDEIS